MILAALAVAAVLDAAPALPPIAERTPNLYQVPERCKDAPYKVVDRFGRPVPVKLGDLPKGMLLLAVWRDIGGCPVLTVASGNPSADAPPPRQFPTPLLDLPAKRADAPSNRR
jgi:hypothetical protein